MFVCVSVYLFSIFKIVNKTSTEASLRQVLISCTVQTVSQYTVLFSLASAQKLHEGPGLLLDFSCLFKLWLGASNSRFLGLPET